jgi:riboflavin synthase
MFTGIVEELGQVAALDGGRLRITSSKVLDGAHVGDSIAVDGCCLTVSQLGAGWWEADLSDETLRRTTLGELRPGDDVNLERPVRLQDRLGGHIVQGHVDGVATLLSRTPGERTDELRFSLAPDLARYVVEKGSITVDGVSLTVAGVSDDAFTVALIPTTLSHTTLGIRQPGDTVNLEVDVVAKYVERLTAGYNGAPSAH